jgi:hypothetical protein
MAGRAEVYPVCHLTLFAHRANAGYTSKTIFEMLLLQKIFRGPERKWTRILQMNLIIPHTYETIFH